MSKSKVIAAKTPEPEPLPAAASLSAALAVPDDATADALLEMGVQSFNQSGRLMARAGLCFLRLRALEPSDPAGASKPFGSGFLARLEERGVGKSHAYNAMHLAEYLASLPPAEAQRMLKVPYTKVLAIAKADPEVVAELLDSGAIDGDAPLSVRELQLQVRDLQRRATNAEAEAEAERLRADTARDYTAKLDAKSGFPAWLRHLRAGVMAECGGIEDRLDTLEQALLTRLMPQAGDNADDAALRLAGAITATHALSAIAARIARIQQHTERSYRDADLSAANPLARLSDAEIARALAARERLCDEAAYQRRLREHQQATATPRRGRPPKPPVAPTRTKKGR